MLLVWSFPWLNLIICNFCAHLLSEAKDEVVRMICQCLVNAKENINQVLATNVTSQEREVTVVDLYLCSSLVL
jgi:hypothetical protein